MNKKLLAAGLVSLLMGAAWSAEKETKKPEAPHPPSYEEAVARLKTVGPDSDVFTWLRAGWAASPRFDPYNGDTGKAEDALWGEIKKEDYEKAAGLAQEILDKNFTHIETHKAADFIYHKLHKPRESQFHRFVALGLLDSLFASGDGKSFETAYKVIQMNEEKAILDALGLKKTGQALVEHDGRRFDRLKVVDEETKKEGELYFDVEPLFAWSEKAFKVKK